MTNVTQADAPAALRLSIPRRREVFAELTPKVERWLAEARVSRECAYAVHLALEELLLNAIEHAGRPRGEEVDILLQAREDDILLRIEEESPPFDPLAAPRPDTRAPLAQRSGGGMGIDLVRKVAKDFRYQRVGDRNRLEVAFR